MKRYVVRVRIRKNNRPESSCSQRHQQGAARWIISKLCQNLSALSDGVRAVDAPAIDAICLE
jgi:hypothetical protein